MQRLTLYMLLTWLVITSFGTPTHPVLAKGPVDQIIITGGFLVEPLIVEDDSVTPYLSMAGLEDFRHGAIEEPKNLGKESYRLERKFYDHGKYFTFDNVTYYPDPEGEQGYIYFDGIHNGSSEYDGKWYQVQPNSEIVLQRVLENADLRSVLLLFSSGTLRIFDAKTFELIAEFILEDMDSLSALQGGVLASPALKFAHMVVSATISYDGRGIFVNYVDGTSAYLDLDTMQNCSTGRRHFVTATLDDSKLIYHAGGVIEVRNHATLELLDTVITNPDFEFAVSADGSIVYGVDPIDQSLTVFDVNGFDFGQVLALDKDKFAQSLSATWDTMYQMVYITDGTRLAGWYPDSRGFQTNTFVESEELAALKADGITIKLAANKHGTSYLYPQIYESGQGGGIYVTEYKVGKYEVDHWAADIPFHQVTLESNVLYGLSSMNTRLYQIDVHTGEILVETRLLQGGDTFTVGQLDLTGLDKAFVPCAAPLIAE